MADTIILLDHGQIQQMAAPEVIYNDPNNVFTAQFIGTPPMNVHKLSDGLHYIGYRPEKIQLFHERPDNSYLYVRRARILTREMLGSETLYKLQILDLDYPTEGYTAMSKSTDMTFGVDEEIYVALRATDLYYFDQDQMRIRDDERLMLMQQMTEGGAK